MWNFWQKRNWLNYALLPISLIFLSLVRLRRWFYQTSWFKKIKIPVPVIVVGNIIVGGSGKTSFVLTLAGFLQTQGLRVGVISRGYLSKTEKDKTIIEVKENSQVEVVGDEPLMIKKSNPKLAVFVGINRVEVAKECFKKKNIDLIISDDGLQHYGLSRDLEIILNHQNHNGLLLPAGPLREPITRLKQADFVIESEQLNYEPKFWQDCFGYQTLSLNDFLELIQSHSSKNVYGYVALAKNENFKKSLEELNIKLKNWFFYQDHYTYQAKDFVNLPCDAIILTSFKDSVKFQKEWFKDTQKCYFLNSNLVIDMNTMNQIWQKINQL